MQKYKIIKIILISLIAIFIIIQFIRPEMKSTNEITSVDITKQIAVPENVQTILKRSCYDCHSNQTVWPWYSNIAPASWLLAEDVKDGRAKVNFSEWGKLSVSKREKKLADICDEITDGEMPLSKYLILHPDARLTDEEKKILCDWVNANSSDEGNDNNEDNK